MWCDVIPDHSCIRPCLPCYLTTETHQCVCIHEDTFGVVCEHPAVELCEGYPQVRPFHHGQVCCVPAIQHIHQPNLVVDSTKHCSETDKTPNISTLWMEHTLKAKQLSHCTYNTCTLLMHKLMLGQPTWKGLTHAVQSWPPVSLRFYGSSRTVPEPWPLLHSCHLWPTWQKPDLKKESKGFQLLKGHRYSNSGNVRNTINNLSGILFIVFISEAFGLWWM